MREQRLSSTTARRGADADPASCASSAPDGLWHMDMISVWVAEHGWCYLNGRSTAARVR